MVDLFSNAVEHCGKAAAEDGGGDADVKTDSRARTKSDRSPNVPENHVLIYVQFSRCGGVATSNNSNNSRAFVGQQSRRPQQRAQRKRASASWPGAPKQQPQKRKKHDEATPGCLRLSFTRHHRLQQQMQYLQINAAQSSRQNHWRLDSRRQSTCDTSRSLRCVERCWQWAKNASA